MLRRPSDHAAPAIQCAFAGRLTRVDEVSRRDGWRNVVTSEIKQLPESARNVLHHPGIPVVALRHEAQMLASTEGKMRVRQRKTHPALTGLCEPRLAGTA